MAATRYVDFNRGNDNNDGLTKQTAYKTLGKLSSVNFGLGSGGSQILLANDSHWEINPTFAASGRVNLDSFGGTESARSIITGYDYAGVTNSRPRITYRYVVSASDWVWDASKQAWYVPFNHSAVDSDMRIAIDEVIIPSVYQGAGSNGINNFINGVNERTLRSYVDTSNRRVYLAYENDSSTVNPSNYFKAPITFGMSSVMTTFYLMPYTTVSGIDARNGGRLIQVTGGDVGLISRGFELKDCSAVNCTGLIQMNTAGIGEGGLFVVDVHDNVMINSYAPGIKTFGQSITGYIRANSHHRGNLGDCTGGGEYIQSTAPASQPLQLNDAYMSEMANGVGTCTFDGCGIYLELGSTNVVVNRAKIVNSFKAFQINSGRKSTILASEAINCDMFGTFTDANLVGSSEYLVAHNKFVSTPNLRSYSRGSQTTFDNAIGAYETGAGIVSAKLINNEFYAFGSNAAQHEAILWYDTGEWNAGRCEVKNNYFSGYDSKLITDQQGTDRTSGSNSLTGTASLVGAGNTSLGQLTDYRGQFYNYPPSVGSREVNPFNFFKGIKL